MFKVMVYDADAFAWNVLGKHRREPKARQHAYEARSSHEWQWVAVAHVSGLKVTVLETNMPGAENLHLLPSFYEPAIFHGR